MTIWSPTTVATKRLRLAAWPCWATSRVMLWKTVPPPFLYCSDTIGLPFWSVVPWALEI